MKNVSRSDKVFDIVNKLLIMIVVLLCIYPLIFVISASISDPTAVSTGKMWLWPVDVSFDGFRMVFNNEAIWVGYRNTIVYAILGTTLHLVLLLPASYALSRKEVKGKIFFLWFILFTMLFNGGLVPTYLLVQSLGMTDTIWAMIVPGVIGAWSILVARSFFESTIPDQLVEAARIDGASDVYMFFKIVLPLSLPIIAVMALFHTVALWNQYFQALIYISDEKLFPLQMILRAILILQETNMEGAGGAGSFENQVRIAAQVKYAVIIVSALPLLIVYPFVQRFFC